jgi:hypothetical protein
MARLVCIRKPLAPRRSGRALGHVMKPLRGRDIGVRLQASIVIGITLLWFASVPGCVAASHKAGLRFWDLVCIICPVLALALTAIMWWSYLRSDRLHGAWVGLATLAVLSPVLLAWFLSLVY